MASVRNKSDVVPLACIRDFSILGLSKEQSGLSALGLRKGQSGLSTLGQRKEQIGLSALGLGKGQCGLSTLGLLKSKVDLGAWFAKMVCLMESFVNSVGAVACRRVHTRLFQNVFKICFPLNWIG